MIAIIMNEGSRRGSDGSVLYCCRCCFINFFCDGDLVVISNRSDLPSFRFPYFALLRSYYLFRAPFLISLDARLRTVKCNNDSLENREFSNENLLRASAARHVLTALPN